MPELYDLDVDECLELLENHHLHVGRVGFEDEDGPVILPVNYQMSAGQVVFHTVSGSPLLEATFQGRVAFQVDEISDQWKEGWSVLMRGTAREATVAETTAAHEKGLESWAHRDSRIIVITPVSITGRRVK